ncbi:MAG: hypothetical protein OHK0041_02980 [Anaerolineales bacterium]
MATFEDVQQYVNELTSLARQLNTFASGLKGVRAEQSGRKPSAVREDAPEYIVAGAEEFSGVLFSEDELNRLNS